MTFEGRNRFPIWSNDGKQLAFQSDREGDLGIFLQPADGTSAAVRLTKPEAGTAHVPNSWSPKGDVFLFTETTGGTSSLWAFSMRDRKATRFGTVESANQLTATFSPDGNWVAYDSSPTAGGPASAVFLQPFPPTGAMYQVSKKGDQGHHPTWSDDGRQILYVPLPGQFVAVSVTTAPTVSFGNPVAIPRTFPFASPTTPRSFDVLKDGSVVGAITAGAEESDVLGAPELRVVLNWIEEVKARVPAR